MCLRPTKTHTNLEAHRCLHKCNKKERNLRHRKEHKQFIFRIYVTQFNDPRGGVEYSFWPFPIMIRDYWFQGVTFPLGSLYMYWGFSCSEGRFPGCYLLCFTLLCCIYMESKMLEWKCWPAVASLPFAGHIGPALGEVQHSKAPRPWPHLGLQSLLL